VSEEVSAMSKRVAEVLVETLQAAGVKRCYGIIGDTVNRIAHAIDASAIEWVHMRNEEAGAFAASAEALFTGELTACAGSCGPGTHIGRRHPVAFGAVGNIKATLEALLPRLRQHESNLFLSSCVKRHQKDQEAVIGMAVYTARAVLHGKGHGVWEMVVENVR
jgi:thiamine pyrophosphate-dependent acetolactate synthase large subunit-like protein